MLYLLLAAVESEWTRDRENTSLCTSETCETSVCETIIIFEQWTEVRRGRVKKKIKLHLTLYPATCTYNPFYFRPFEICIIARTVSKQRNKVNIFIKGRRYVFYTFIFVIILKTLRLN